MTVSAFAPAKINLTLHVTGQRTDGYHLLDSLVCFADIGDLVTVAFDAALSLTVTGPRAKGVPTDDSNLVLKAARFLDPNGMAHITLDKHLPAAAGIGGGSSDAAATLRALSELWEVPLPDSTVTLGADVPVCLHPMALRMQGVGDLLTPVAPLPETHAVLVNPGVDVPTPAVFNALKHKDNAPMEGVPTFADTRALARWLAEQRNDLQAPAIGQAPLILDVLDRLDDGLFAAMSGSGATCFALYTSAAEARAKARDLSQDQPGWWVAPCRLS
ncbi:4-(cytidine 5'-diphospho)-2-C-methyl-D-erythritol kinase [Cognatishimia sp. MH4019]|uniref:4-(cytidine 5'-diphospho)-2-C-methyl-D-erythritol kinase n=1 Tax=Cognatishimia sp. MH4019 TaxID=2854030 RepID=UPI001CD41123|nr:4-(cytidine 5'-diphospho)-2-C-methyl-D-erythritol kinase [Cognatishimia sp. MH4019]